MNLECHDQSTAAPHGPQLGDYEQLAAWLRTNGQPEGGRRLGCLGSGRLGKQRLRLLLFPFVTRAGPPR